MFNLAQESSMGTLLSSSSKLSHASMWYNLESHKFIGPLQLHSTLYK